MLAVCNPLDQSVLIVRRSMAIKLGAITSGQDCCFANRMVVSKRLERLFEHVGGKGQTLSNGYRRSIVVDSYGKKRHEGLQIIESKFCHFKECGVFVQLAIKLPPKTVNFLILYLNRYQKDGFLD